MIVAKQLPLPNRPIQECLTIPLSQAQDLLLVAMYGEVKDVASKCSGIVLFPSTIR